MTVLCNESGDYVTYHSDQHGFHNPKEVWQSSRVEIAAVGDSFVQGYCVPSDQNFVSLIRNRHPATLNLGMAGEAPLLMLATMQGVSAALSTKNRLVVLLRRKRLEGFVG